MNMSSDDAFADEIIEIFVEEVTEVLEQIDEHLPKWKGDQSNQASLKEVRRAFHTLKGSGRMVHAESIGELAWSVENMLNRIIDGTLKTTPMAFELIAEVRTAVPTLVKAFENRQAAALSGININELIGKANAIVEGKQAAPAAAVTSTVTPEKTAIPMATAPAAVAEPADQVELRALQERVSELGNYIDEFKRNLVAVSTQLDTLSTRLNTQPQSVDPQAMQQRIDDNAKEIQDLKYFVKTTSQQLMTSATEVQQKLTAKVEKQLKDVADMGDQLQADFRAEAEQIRTENEAKTKRWSMMSAVICAGAVLAYVLLAR